MRDAKISGIARVTLVALLFGVFGALSSCEKEGAALQEHGAFSHVGEVTEARSGVRLFYGLPVGGAQTGALGPEWGGKQGRYRLT